MRRALLVVASFLLLVTASAAASRPVITERDSGKTFRVRRGHDLTLRLSNRYVWSEPRVTGRAIRLMPVEYFVDPGFLEWRIRPRARGRARIAAVGAREGAAGRFFRILVIVR